MFPTLPGTTDLNTNRYNRLSNSTATRRVVEFLPHLSTTVNGALLQTRRLKSLPARLEGLEVPSSPIFASLPGAIGQGKTLFKHFKGRAAASIAQLPRQLRHLRTGWRPIVGGPGLPAVSATARHCRHCHRRCLLASCYANDLRPPVIVLQVSCAINHQSKRGAGLMMFRTAVSWKRRPLSRAALLPIPTCNAFCSLVVCGPDFE